MILPKEILDKIIVYSNNFDLALELNDKYVIDKICKKINFTYEDILNKEEVDISKLIILNKKYFTDFQDFLYKSSKFRKEPYYYYIGNNIVICKQHKYLSKRETNYMNIYI